MFLLLLIAPKQKNFCVTKDRVPLRGLAEAGPRIVCLLPSQAQGACAPCASSPAGGAKNTCVGVGGVRGKA